MNTRARKSDVGKLPTSALIEAAVDEFARCDQSSLIALSFQQSLASAGCDLQVCGLQFVSVKAGLCYSVCFIPDLGGG